MGNNDVNLPLDHNPVTNQIIRELVWLQPAESRNSTLYSLSLFVEILLK